MRWRLGSERALPVEGGLRGQGQSKGACNQGHRRPVIACWARRAPLRAGAYRREARARLRCVGAAPELTGLPRTATGWTLAASRRTVGGCQRLAVRRHSPKAGVVVRPRSLLAIAAATAVIVSAAILAVAARSAGRRTRSQPSALLRFPGWQRDLGVCRGRRVPRHDVPTRGALGTAGTKSPPWFFFLLSAAALIGWAVVTIAIVQAEVGIDGDNARSQRGFILLGTAIFICCWKSSAAASS